LGNADTNVHDMPPVKAMLAEVSCQLRR
jgi:hypothetical protein